MRQLRHSTPAMQIRDVHASVLRIRCRRIMMVPLLLGWSASSTFGQEPSLQSDRGVDQFFRPVVDDQQSATLFQWGNTASVHADTSMPDLNDQIVTDRPDFTEASSTVGRGVAQLELGYTFSFDDAAGAETRSHSFPETLLRYGIAQDWMELRLGWNYASESINGLRTDGAEDLYLGAKFGLTAQDGFLPEMALVPQLTVPAGARALSSDRVSPGVNWLYGSDINEFLSAGGSTQFNRTLDDGTADFYT